jgi:myo-inositol 2-dehydrogenase/D-chiro-inositol 1-dehydrogenase
MLRLALIGCGGHAATTHAPSLAHYTSLYPGAIELAAACDTDITRAERFCRTFGFVNAYADWQEMLRTARPDAVIATLPVDRTYDIGISLLQQGLPCLLEKPPGVSLSEATALTEVARQTRTPHMVSLNRRFNPFLNRALAWVRQTGPLRYVHARMLRHNRREPDFLWSTGVHVVDAMRYIGGEIAQWKITILSDLESSEALEATSSTFWYVIDLRFVSGCIGRIDILTTIGMVDEAFELYGDDFRASVTTMNRGGETVRCWRQGELEIDETADTTVPLFLRDGSYQETCAFIEGLQSNAPLHPTLAEVAPGMQLCAIE